MNAQRLIISNVFDVHHQYWGRGGPRCTSLGLEVAGQRHFSIRLNGWQELQSNVAVTALFRTPGDWNELVGWVSHTEGHVFQAFPPSSVSVAVAIWGLVTGWLTFLLFTPWLFEARRLVQVGVGVGTAVLLVVATHAALRARRVRTEKAALNACRAELTNWAEASEFGTPNPTFERTGSGR